jgi:hypothetical protein
VRSPPEEEWIQVGSDLVLVSIPFVHPDFSFRHVLPISFSLSKKIKRIPDGLKWGIRVDNGEACLLFIDMPFFV